MPGSETAAERTRENPDEGFCCIVKKIEEWRRDKSPPPVYRSPAEAMPSQQSPHLAVGPLLKMETLEGVAEIAGDIVGAGKTVRGVEDVDSSRLEEAMDHLKVGIDVVRVKVLEKLVAEGDVGASVGQVEVVTIVDDKLEIVGCDLAR